jgi:hypothetical protein
MITSGFSPRIGAVIASRAAAKASPSCKRVVMSRKTIPFFGKSGIVRIFEES